MDNRVIRFGHCELRMSTRELRVRGELRAIEPRPFELLTYLLQRHGAVVTKEELLDAVWRDESVTPGVIASAVMKVRKLIDDSDPDDAIIRTVHGIGYCFTGHAFTNADEPATEGGCVLALLPFENDTGEADLDWVELGLLTMVLRPLAQDGHLDVAAIASVLQALQTVGADAPLAERTAVLARLLGAARVVHSVVRGKKGGYCIDVTIVGRDGERLSQQWSGPDLLQLARQLSEHLGLLCRAEPLSAPRGDDLQDDTSGWTLGRALQAMAEQKWQAALALLDAALRLEPEHPVARLERLRALVALDDNAAFETGQALAAQARAAHDRQQEAAVQLELAQAYAKRRLNEQAREHLDEALRLAEGQASVRWRFDASVLAAELAMGRFDWGTAAQALDRADALCQATGSVFDRIRALSTRVVLKAVTDELRLAWSYARQTADLCSRHGLKADQSRAECNYANASGSLGLYDLAQRHGELALALSRETKAATFTTVAAALLCGIYRTMRKPHHQARVLRELDQIDAGGAPTNPIYHLVGRAHQRITTHQYEEAATLLREAAERARQAGRGLEVHFVLPLLAAVLAHAGHLDEAAATCARMQASADLTHDRNLQAATLHCQAQIALAVGDRAGALQRLQTARGVAPEGWWRGHSGIDGAWLAIESGALDVAAAMLDGLDTWQEQTPFGMALTARLAWAQGDAQRARERHGQLMNMAGVDVPPYWVALGSHYSADAAKGPQATALPPTPRLPSWV
jgi:DNA-binding winged helix-turn-helix (wHTH) protein/tetratricopeptide (TPR) repeat protein